MLRLIFPVLSLSLCLLMSNPVGAQGDERREQIERLKREAMELIQSGQKDRAEDLLEKVASLTQETDKERELQRLSDVESPENLQRSLEGLERRIEELRKSGGDQTKIAQAERMAEHLRARTRSGASPKPFRPEMVLKQPQPEAARRLEHMRAAVEHLRQAGLVDAANHVNEMADRLQREMHHEGRERAGDPIREIMNQLGEMRREVAELRERLDRQER